MVLGRYEIKVYLSSTLLYCSILVYSSDLQGQYNYIDWTTEGTSPYNNESTKFNCWIFYVPKGVKLILIMHKQRLISVIYTSLHFSPLDYRLDK